ncbi:MAG: beta-lactamase family protein [Planctomycetota bacterium]|nr:beta-lactamase family protein [Planctomycetota bacterium]
MLATAAAASVEAPQPLDAIVRRHAGPFVAEKPYLATVIGVTTPYGRRVWGFGGIERDGERVTPDGKTVYEIGSITKTFTGSLLADLAREGKVEIDDPVQKHLPADWTMPTRDGRQISLLHLTTHTSSLPRLPPGFGPFMVLTASVNDPYSRYESENLRLSLSQIELDRPIGSRHEYSNLGVGLLGEALAHAAQEPDSAALFESRLLHPLGMTDTNFDPTEEQLSRLAPPFKANGTAAHIWHFKCLKSCGGLRSTADDLLTYAEAALGRTETSLKPAFDVAMQPWRQTCEGERAIGFGWYVQPMDLPRKTNGASRSGRLIWHGGATGGYRTFLGLLPECDSAIVVLSNSTESVDPALTWPVMKAIAREHAKR